MEDIEPNSFLITLEEEIIKILLLKNSTKILVRLSLILQSNLAILSLKIEDFEKWKIRLNTRGNIMPKLVRDMEEDFKYGLMDRDMKGFGCMIRQTDRVG